MDKKILPRLFCCTVCVLLIAGGILTLNRITKRKESVKQVTPFFQQTEDFDVLCFGASHSLLAYMPMELWDDYGIVSYNLSSGGTRLPVTYWQIVNAFNHKVPKLVIIDCCFVDDRKFYELAYVHDALDGFPLCVDKVNAVIDLVEPEKRAELIFPFTLYHSRWKELTEEDFTLALTKEKGALSFSEVTEVPRYERVSPSELQQLSNIGFDYLRRSIEYCKSRGVEVLLTCIPFPASKNSQDIAYTVSAIAEEYGVNCLDLYTLEPLVDYDTDMADNNHLNVLGGKKISAYLGKYIMENYDIRDQRENPAYASWHRDYAEYREYKAGLIAEQFLGHGNLRSALMLLCDKDFSSIIYLPPESEAYQEPEITKLMETLGIDVSALDQASPQLLVVDNIEGACHILRQGDKVESAFGRLAFTQAEGKDMALLNGESLLIQEGTGILAAVIALDNSSGTVIASGGLRES